MQLIGYPSHQISKTKLLYSATLIAQKICVRIDFLVCTCVWTRELFNNYRRYDRTRTTTAHAHHVELHLPSTINGASPTTTTSHTQHHQGSCAPRWATLHTSDDLINKNKLLTTFTLNSSFNSKHKTHLPSLTSRIYHSINSSPTTFKR